MDRLATLAAMLNAQPGPFHGWRVGMYENRPGEPDPPFWVPALERYFWFIGKAAIDGVDRSLSVALDLDEWRYRDDETIVYNVMSDAMYKLTEMPLPDFPAEGESPLSSA